RGTFITVSKKQNWAKCSAACRDNSCIPSTDGPRSLGSRTQEWEGCQGKSQVLSLKSAWSNSKECSQKASEIPPKREAVSYKGSSEQYSFSSGVPELTRPCLSYTDHCAASSSVKITGQGAYLQSLERSSRAWVLSTGKPQASDEGLRFPPNCLAEWKQGTDGESKGNIWYNPIPEEEDSRCGKMAADYGNPWKKRELEGSMDNKKECWARKRAGIIGQPNRVPRIERHNSDTQALAGQSEPSGASGPSDSPGAQKKPGMMDRIKSPGTVRRLSMKMRKLPELRRKLSLRSSRSQRQGQTEGTSPLNARKESGNVISRYHLDSSVSAPERPPRRSSRRGKSASKGGYLSDGDSPELIAKHDPQEGAGVLDPSAFRPYSLAEQPRCAQRLSGLMSVHLYRLEEVKSPRVDSKEVFCAIQVDGVTRARTALLTCRGTFLSLNHTFNLELERAQLLKLVVFSRDPSASRNRVCCLGAVAIPPLFRGSRSQQLAVKLEPRGLLYVKLTLVEQWDTPAKPSDQEPRVFGIELRQLVEKEGSAIKVPLIIQKSVSEIEKRGLKVVGLYRLCGSAAVKKELRDAFERDSTAVTLSEDLYPDINVVTAGILKDYLRELPSPLITRTLYEVVLDAMTKRPPKSTLSKRESDAQRSAHTVTLLDCLPEAEKATLTVLLDHLSLVASYSECNRMTCQNLAVCFGPVLLTPTQEPWRPGGRSFAHSEEIASAVDFKRHIEALHYLLQLWPLPKGRAPDPPDPEPPVSQNSLRRHQRPVLRLDLSKDSVVSRRGRGRLESPPCNRYAGDWSVCGRDFLSMPEADYDEVAGTDSDEEEGRGELGKRDWDPQRPLYVSDFTLDPQDIDLDAPFTTRLSLKDFDTLISDLERELGKQINICL
uniref:Rho GTPase-activating protein SYDE1 n=1 Tax=Lepisosteus oculatus TaxID=7918 RepID=W5MQQ7_LEPOC